MLELQKSFLLVKFFNQISCNKGLKVKILCFFLCFFCLTPLFSLPSPPGGLNVRAPGRPLCSWRHIAWRNTKICVHGASWIDRKRGKCWKMQLFESKLRVFIWVKWKQSICSITPVYSSTFYSLFLAFFVLEIFKFKHDMFFVRNSAIIFKFNWFEQPWHLGALEL